MALAAVLAVWTASPAVGQTHLLHLAWDPNREPDIVTYYVHVGTAPGDWNVAIQGVPANQTTYAFPATAGIRYYFAVRGVNSGGDWSPLSAVVSGGVPAFVQPANQVGVVGALVTPVALDVVDPDGGVLHFSAVNLPAGLSINASTGVIVGTPSTIGTRTVTVSAFDGTVTVQRSFTWTINPVPAVVVADSVRPAGGSGVSQEFVLRYSDDLGAADLASAWVWFNATFASSSARSCLLYYSPAANLLYMLNDTGTVWSSATLGTSTTLQNSQCAADVSASSASIKGPVLTLNLNMTFRATFAGAKHVYLYARSAGGSISGWHDRGDWTVPTGPAAAAPVVTVDSISPSGASGAAQTFALQYSNTAGAANIETAWVWFNGTFAPSSANSCLVYYNRGINTVFLLNDGASVWQPATLGSATTLQNSQCSLAVGSSSAASNGTTLRLNLAMTFKPSFAGAKNVYMYGSSVGGINTGWHDRGDWTVPAGSSPGGSLAETVAPAAAVVTADTATPGTGTGASHLFALQYSNTAGAGNFGTAWVWFNATLASSSANSCLIYYQPPTNTVLLLSDAGSVWQPATLGSASTLQNSQCSVDVVSSSATRNGNTLALSLAVTFKAGYSGAKNIYMYANSANGPNSGWQDRGDWTVP